MKDYFDEEEYLEDIYGDEIKVGDGFYRIKELVRGYQTRVNLVHEKNFVQYCEDELQTKKEER